MLNKETTRIRYKILARFVLYIPERGGSVWEIDCKKCTMDKIGSEPCRWVGAVWVREFSSKRRCITILRTILKLYYKGVVIYTFCSGHEMTHQAHNSS